MTAVAGIVLAGGRSSRMGRPKADLDWHGVPLVRHVCAVVASAVPGAIVVVAAPGQALPPLPEGVAVTHDAQEGRGPLEGLAAGLKAVDGAAFVTGVDLPFLTPALIRRVTDALGGADAAVAVAGGARQPLAAAYRTTLLPAIEQRLAEGRRSLQGLLASVRTVDVDADDLADALRDLDEPEDYVAALRA